MPFGPASYILVPILQKGMVFKENHMLGAIRGSVSLVFFGQIMQLGSGAGGNGGSGSLRNSNNMLTKVVMYAELFRGRMFLDFSCIAYHL